MSSQRTDEPSAEALDELLRLLHVGARGAEDLQVGDAFHLIIERGSGKSWLLRACIVDGNAAPLPHGAAYDDTLTPQESVPRAALVVERLLANARKAARRRLDAIRAALGDP